MFPERQSGFAIVQVTWFAHEAHLSRALLESEGIDAWVLDATQIGVQWHVAGALGGVKVGVRAEDAERARTLLARDHSGALAEIDELSLPAADEERCPRCGSSATKSSRTTARPGVGSWIRMTVFFLLGILVPEKRHLVRRACPSCGLFWSEQK
jgi:ribosomal protein S27AE